MFEGPPLYILSQAKFYFIEANKGLILSSNFINLLTDSVHSKYLLHIFAKPGEECRRRESADDAGQSARDS